MLKLFIEAGPAAWPLGLESVLALAIILERLFTLSRLRRIENEAFARLRSDLLKGKRDTLQDPSLSAAPLTRVLDSLTELTGASEDAMQHAAEIALSLQRIRLRRYLGTLATIASTAPFIGLFGTVLGVMTAFQAMSTQGLTSELMASGISEALSATAVGLMVAVPSVIAYNFFTGRAMTLLLDIQRHVALLAPLMRQSGPARTPEHLNA